MSGFTAFTVISFGVLLGLRNLAGRNIRPSDERATCVWRIADLCRKSVIRHTQDRCVPSSEFARPAAGRPCNSAGGSLIAIPIDSVPRAGISRTAASAVINFALHSASPLRMLAYEWIESTL